MQFSPIVEKISKSRPDGLHLLPPDGIGSEDALVAPWTVDAKKFGQFYISIFDEWVKKDVGKYYVQLFDAALAGTVGQMPGVCILAKLAVTPPLWNSMATCMHVIIMFFQNIKSEI